MRLIFMGTPSYAAPLLISLRASWDSVDAVYTAPDRRRGRGLKDRYPPVKQTALELGLPVFQPPSLRSPDVIDEFRGLAPDLVVVAAYGLLVPAEMLTVPKLGFVNVHPSLLPKYRGPSPVVTALLDGATSTGVSLMLLNRGMDSGPLLAQRSTAIGAEETAESLIQRLFALGGRLLDRALPEWAAGEITVQPQDHEAATFTRKVVKADGQVDWTRPADELCRRARAYQPWPGMFTTWRGKNLKLQGFHALTGGPALVPGQTAALPGMGGGVAIGAGDGSAVGVAIGAGEGSVVGVETLQLEGRRAQPAAEFLRGQPEFGTALVGKGG